MAGQPKHNPPQGMEPYDLGGQDDLGALSTEQQAKLNKFKVIYYVNRAMSCFIGLESRWFIPTS